MKRSAPLKPGKGLKPSTKRMKSRHRAIGNPTKAEQAQQDAQRADGCALCRLLGFAFGANPELLSPCGPTRIHHRTTGDLHGNKQLGQDATVALGDWHHQGYPHAGEQADSMRTAYGPSLQLHKKDFLDVIADHLGERSTAALQRFQDDRIQSKGDTDAP